MLKLIQLRDISHPMSQANPLIQNHQWSGQLLGSQFIEWCHTIFFFFPITSTPLASIVFLIRQTLKISPWFLRIFILKWDLLYQNSLYPLTSWAGLLGPIEFHSMDRHNRWWWWLLQMLKTPCTKILSIKVLSTRYRVYLILLCTLYLIVSIHLLLIGSKYKFAKY